MRLIERTAHYICNEPNPLVQIMYFICAFGGFYVYVTESFHLMPNPYVAWYHKYIGTVIMMLCYASYFAACWVDPGKLCNKTERADVIKAVKRYPYDGMMFQKKNKCTTCEIDKPARSKHCGMCGACIQKFDHHCVWINQAVGLYNYRFFLLFLFFHVIICVYGTVIGLYMLQYFTDKDKLWEQTFVNANGERF